MNREDEIEKAANIILVNSFDVHIVEQKAKEILEVFAKAGYSSSQASNGLRNLKELSEVAELDGYINGLVYNSTTYNPAALQNLFWKAMESIQTSSQATPKPVEGDAVEFAEWIRKNGWEPDPAEQGIWFKQHGLTLSRRTSAQLYQRFKNTPQSKK